MKSLGIVAYNFQPEGIRTLSFFFYTSGPSCSILTTSIVNVLLKFQMLKIFVEKK